MPVTIAPRDFTLRKTDFSFTFYYKLGNVLRSTLLDELPRPPDDDPIDANSPSPLQTAYDAHAEAKSPPSGQTATFVDRFEWRDFAKSRTAVYVSDDFLKSVLLAHLHIHLHKENYIETVFRVHRSTYRVQHEIELSNIRSYDGISAVEVSVLRHGYLVIIVRFHLDVDINAFTALEYIRHPELLGHQMKRSTPGPLVVLARAVLDDLYQPIEHALDFLSLKKLDLECKTWVPVTSLRGETWDKRQLSRPYVGTYVTWNRARNRTSDEDSNAFKRFVVAAARCTPEFFRRFDNVDSYYRSYRNIYGPGSSAVFVTRRGWCVVYGGGQDREIFYLGVVEPSHFAISVIDTASRARRSYTRTLLDDGAPIFRTLNMNILEAVGTQRGLSESRSPIQWARRQWSAGKSIRTLTKSMSEATEYLAHARMASPCGDMSTLLRAHLVSHTARAAVRRFSDLVSLEEVDSAANRTVARYTAFLRTNSDYQQFLTLKLTIYILLLTAGAIILASLTLLVDSGWLSLLWHKAAEIFRAVAGALRTD